MQVRNNKGVKPKEAWGKMGTDCMLKRRQTWQNLVADQLEAQ